MRTFVGLLLIGCLALLGWMVWAHYASTMHGPTPTPKLEPPQTPSVSEESPNETVPLPGAPVVPPPEPVKTVEPQAPADPPPAEAPAPLPASPESAPAPPPAAKTPPLIPPGRVASADQALGAALKLHAELYPDLLADRFMSAVPKGKLEGTVSVYLDADPKKRSEKKATYWVARKDGSWHAYSEVPLREDYDFVFEEVGRLYIEQHFGSATFIRKPELVREPAPPRLKAKIMDGPQPQEIELSFEKDERAGWFVKQHTGGGEP